MTKLKATDQFVIRPIAMADLDQLMVLAAKTGAGFTSLMPDKEFLSKKIQSSLDSFASDDKANAKQFLLTLEDKLHNKIIGTTAVKVSYGNEPFYSYKVNTIMHSSESIQIFKEHKVLNLVNDYQNATHVCSLFLDPEYRGRALGPLLSWSRFLLIATFPELFSETLVAEMRGLFDEHGNSPFWQYFAQEFIGLTFDEADMMTGTGNKQFISDLFPKTPVYVCTLHHKAREVISRVHPDTAAAKRMLEAQGFEDKNYIDIFDAGPALEATRDRVSCIADAKLFTVTAIVDDISAPETYMLANTKKEFRALVAEVTLKAEQLIIDTKTAQLLQVAVGEQLRIIQG